jgi:hypothetical protein
MERYCQLGRLLPTGDDVAIIGAFEDRAKCEEAGLILAEMAKVQAEIDAILQSAKR